jgi:hypothetical protein
MKISVEGENGEGHKKKSVSDNFRPKPTKF